MTEGGPIACGCTCAPRSPGNGAGDFDFVNTLDLFRSSDMSKASSVMDWTDAVKAREGSTGAFVKSGIAKPATPHTLRDAFCHAPAAVRARHPHRASVARALGCGDHDVHPCAQRGWRCRAQSGRQHGCASRSGHPTPASRCSKPAGRDRGKSWPGPAKAAFRLIAVHQSSKAGQLGKF